MAEEGGEGGGGGARGGGGTRNLRGKSRFFLKGTRSTREKI